ncbi:MAG: hypothetical protein ACXQTT_00170, partial [Candidatus Syntropharchaeia archaeon]
MIEVVNLIWKYHRSVAVVVLLVITGTAGATSHAVPIDTANPPGEIDVFIDFGGIELSFNGPDAIQRAIIAEAYNYPPNDPSIDGPSSGYVNESYSFTIVATDNDGDAIK